MSHALRICIADDEPDMRDYLARILPRLGHEVVAAAENGRQLVSDCARMAPDLVITDVSMPELDGRAAIETVRRLRPVPVIFVSASEEHVTSAPETISTTFYLTKPIDRQNLARAISAVMLAPGDA